MKKLLCKRFNPFTAEEAINDWGEYEPQKENLLEFWGSVQPLMGRKLEALPEGFRNSDAYTIITTFYLRSVEIGSSKSSLQDKVVLWNEDYDVVSVKRWSTHYEVIVCKSKQ